MPTFTIKVVVTNKGNTSVSAHVGASLVGASDHVEYFNTSEDVKYTFAVGDTTVTRYQQLTSVHIRNIIFMSPSGKVRNLLGLVKNMP